MRFITFAFFGLLTACANSHAGPRPDAGDRDASDPDAATDGGCRGSRLVCVFGCGSDAEAPPECTDGAWSCPPGTVDAATCPMTCGGPPPAPDCRCDGDRWRCPPTGSCPDDINPWDPSDPANACGPEGSTCEEGGEDPCGGALSCSCDSGRWTCVVAEPDPVCYCRREPREGDRCAVAEGEICGQCCPNAEGPNWDPMLCEDGRWASAVCLVDCAPVVEVCSVDPRSQIGERCDIEGQECGDECCGNATVCSSGRWMLGPDDAACRACLSYECGDGLCNEGQYCSSSPGPDDVPISQCVSLPEGCGDCGCIPLDEGYECEMIRGHPHVSAGRRRS